jgi:peptidyl-tRNA hydrolase, PTH1 family
VSSISIIAGLGNPGERYEFTRHNIGFMVLDLLAERAGTRIKRDECRALISSAEIEGKRVELVKPQTFMNLSGESLLCLMKRRPLSQPQNFLVVVDDLALPFGTLRLRTRGSSGGHNGLKSIIEKFGTDEFPRLRVGIQPEHSIGNTKSFVLEKFPSSLHSQVEEVLERAAEAVRSVLTDGMERAMSVYNQ